MSIKFVCSCGKRLRARDEMAARRSICPRCGAPVGIPSREGPVRGAAAAPLSPAERFRTRRVVPRTATLPEELLTAEAAHGGLTPRRSPGTDAAVAVPAPVPLDPEDVQPAAPPKPKRSYFRRGQMETWWLHCLLYPLRAFFLILGLAALLTLISGTTVLLIPELLQLRARPGWQQMACAAYLLIPLAAAGYACAVFDCVLEAGVAGQAAYLAWPGRNLGPALAAGGRWFVCFLAGPALLAAVVVAFWMYCGDLLPFDWFVVGELSVVTVGYWLFVLASVSVRGDLTGLHPLRVIDLIHRLGYRSAVVAVVATALAGAHAWLALAALDGIHRDARGWLWLFAAWAGGLISGVFVFRLLGFWCHQRKDMMVESSASVGA